MALKIKGTTLVQDDPRQNKQRGPIDNMAPAEKKAVASTKPAVAAESDMEEPSKPETGSAPKKPAPKSPKRKAPVREEAEQPTNKQNKIPKFMTTWSI